jgi:aryl-alcohol dehydrogenase-like predicted oxidoreductase
VKPGGFFSGGDEMEYRRLGQSGLKISALCMGSMQFGWTADEGTSFKILDAAYRAGINFIDTADIYSFWAKDNPGGVSEEIIGRWLKESKIPRQSIVIATKVRGRMGNGINDEGLSRKHILQSIEDSLRRLQTDYIDLYQVHWPDDSTRIEETLKTMDDLVHQGKARYLGCSNFQAWQLIQSLWVAEKRGLCGFDCIQPHYNLVHRSEFERELLPACREYGIGVIPYSPLAGGFLSGKYNRGNTQVNSQRQSSAERYFTERNWLLLELLQKIGTDCHEASVSQVALAWILKNKQISSLIIGPRTLKQLEDNLGAVGVNLDEEQMDNLNKATCWE